MQGRSWMAALTLAAGLTPAASLAGKPATPTDAPADARAVKLDLRIAGLGAGGCDVEVKPGHKGCTFEAKSRHVKSDGYLSLLLRDVRTQSADRDCTFAITIKEPGRGERTVRRGLRLSNQPVPGGQPLTCYLSSPSKLARAGAAENTRR
jgi:hypothetical protein